MRVLLINQPKTNFLSLMASRTSTVSKLPNIVDLVHMLPAYEVVRVYQIRFKRYIFGDIVNLRDMDSN